MGRMAREILAHGAHQQEGGRVWYGGKGLPNGLVKVFNEDCSAKLCNLAGTSPQAPDEQLFSYSKDDIDHLSDCLGIQWESSKSIPFRVEVPYLGFLWNLCTQFVHLLDAKKLKYLTVIMEWEQKCTHNLHEVQRLYSKLLHAALVLPAGWAHLTSMEAMLASFNDNPFLPHTPP